MADSIAQDTANLHLDEVTGERVSKSELKKRQKQRQQDEKKKEKAAAAPPQKEAKKKEAEVELTPNVSNVLLHTKITMALLIHLNSIDPAALMARHHALQLT